MQVEGQAHTPCAALTGREQEVLRLFGAGYKPREIAAQLYISPNTVRQYACAILTKTGARTRAQAAYDAGMQAGRDAAEARAARLEAALREIVGMGRVCDCFEICVHPACADSFGAVMVALEALAETEAGDGTSCTLSSVLFPPG